MSSSVAGCWIDNLRPITPAERAAWKVYLAMHRDHWRAARAMFRRVHSGMPATAAVLGFVSCGATVRTGKCVNQDWKEQSRRGMIDAARQESKRFLNLPRVNQDWVLIDA